MSRLKLAYRLTEIWIALAASFSAVGCQSGSPAYVLLSERRDVIAYRDERYPTVYVADANGVRAAGEGYAMLSRDGRHLLLIKHKLDDTSVYRKGAPVSLLEIPTRKTHYTHLPRDFPMFDLEVWFQAGPRLFLAVEDSQTCLSWSPATGWQAAQRPSDQPQTHMQDDFASSIFYGDDKLSNPLILQPDPLNARRTVWVHPNGRKIELLRRNDVPLSVGGLLLTSPLALVPGVNGYYFLAWYNVFLSGQRGFGDHPERDLDELARQVKAGVIHPPADDKREVQQPCTCPQGTALGLVKRLLPTHVNRFRYQNIPKENGYDVFELESRGDEIMLRGSSAGAMASALNWYLEHYCHCQVSWLGNQLNLPDPLPTVPAKVRRVSPHQYRYWLNYCAFSYSLAFWDWPQWEQFIDWMALHGVNMPLALTGQEATWRAVGKRFGLTDAQMGAFLPGPAYLPFGWMGCLDGWGGPLPQSWIDKHVDLQRRILARERDFGMMPVLQGFTGHVPAGLREKFPSAKFRSTKWGGFAATTFIDPTDPLFGEVGKAFMEEQTRLYGTDHFYASDTFIEMMPPSNDPAFLAAMGKAVYGSMTASDPEARWLMMGWIFINNARFWQPPQAKALFGAVPDDRLILLEMGRDKYLETEAYYGKPWIWTTIRNYGNVVDLGDDLRNIIARAGGAMASSRRGRLCGSGAIMEGLGYDPAVFELVADLNWRDDIKDVEPWLEEFIHHRYGRQLPKMTQAWRTLLDTAYDKPGGDGTVWMRPGLKLRKHARAPIRYDNGALAGAAQLMLDCADQLGDVDTYRYDVVNVVRQVLVNSARPIYEEMMQAYQEKDRKRVAAAGARLRGLITDVDTLLRTRREFLLGRWLADAKRWATDADEARLYEWNARTQITLWGPPDSTLQGYARKHWAGLVADFYGGRWQLFLQRLDEAFAADKGFDSDAFDQECRAWEDRWTRATNAYASEPAGDSITIARQMLAKHAAKSSAVPH